MPPADTACRLLAKGEGRLEAGTAVGVKGPPSGILPPNGMAAGSPLLRLRRTVAPGNSGEGGAEAPPLPLAPAATCSRMACRRSHSMGTDRRVGPGAEPAGHTSVGEAGGRQVTGEEWWQQPFLLACRSRVHARGPHQLPPSLLTPSKLRTAHSNSAQQIPRPQCTVQLKHTWAELERPPLLIRCNGQPQAAHRSQPRIECAAAGCRLQLWIPCCCCCHRRCCCRLWGAC